MLSWLVENSSTVYLVLGIAALALAVGWWMSPYEDPRDRARQRAKQRRLTRKQLCLIGLAVVAGLCAGVWMLGRWVDTDSKRLVRIIEDMAAGVTQKDPDRVFKHVSEEFQYAGYKKSAFRALAEPHIRSGQVEDIQLNDFETKDVSRENRTGSVKFWVKAKGRDLYNDLGWRCFATFVLDKDGEWRLKSLRFTQPHVNPEDGPEQMLPVQ
ncbi:MAG TPA: hypothetical protein VG013_29135 [Gemmataceae bacterium]|jgi:hypothetical protein|nr:hypothetical protein [Gemmataceae bacterium]